MSFSNDDRLMQRYVDGELSETEAAAFAARILADNELRQRTEALEQVKLGFVSAREHATGPAVAPVGFASRVMAEVRGMPSREQMKQLDLSEGAVRLCRRLLLAAAVLFGLGLGWQSGIFSPNGSDKVEAASPAEIEAEMQRLDDEAFREAKGTGAPRRGK